VDGGAEIGFGERAFAKSQPRFGSQAVGFLLAVAPLPVRPSGHLGPQQSRARHFALIVEIAGPEQVAPEHVLIVARRRRDVTRQRQDPIAPGKFVTVAQGDAMVSESDRQVGADASRDIVPD